jgi:cytochrome c oxidase subunit IV
MNDSHALEVKKHVRVYLLVFAALLVGTVLTVGAAYIPDHLIPFGESGGIALALLIAGVKAFLVAGYFMHLISEKKLIYSILIFTGLFFAALLYLTIWSMEPQNLIHIRNVT